MVYVARFLLFVDNLETFKCTSVISAMLLNFKSELDPNVFKYFESENMRWNYLNVIFQYNLKYRI